MSSKDAEARLYMRMVLVSCRSCFLMPRVKYMKQLATWRLNWWLWDLIAGAYLRELSHTQNHNAEGRVSW
jgi:late competence protein required for DNA uptake (superfamily II DNA/RNA helicase)